MTAPKMVGEDEQSFRMHDGSSEFRVPKSGLSKTLQDKIRGMAEPQNLAMGGAAAPPSWYTGSIPTDGFIPVGGHSLSSDTMSEDDWRQAQALQDEEKAASQMYASMGDAKAATRAAQPKPRTVVKYSDVVARPVEPGWTPEPATQFGNIDIAPERVAATDRLNALTFADPAKTALDQAYSSAIPAPRTLNSNDSKGIDGRLPPGVRPEVSAAPATAPEAVSVAPAAAPRGTGVGMGQPGAKDILAGFEQQKRGAEDLSDAAAVQGKIEGERLAAQGRALEIAAIEDQDWRAKAAAKSADDVSRWESAQEEMRNINTTVDPGRYWASKSTGGKVAGIIGLALGGLGAGPDGVNRAATMLNNAIDRDIDAQKAEFSARLAKGKAGIDAANTMYGMSRQLFADEVAARAATRASAYALVENEAQKRIAAAKSPEDQARLQVLLGGIQQEIGKSKNEMRKASDTSALQWAELGAKQAKAPGTADDKKTLTQLAEHEGNIQKNARELKALIQQYGTQEKIQPGIEARMNQLRSALIVDSAKMKDALGVVREPDEAREGRALGFEPGYWQRTDNALAGITGFAGQGAERLKTAKEVRGIK